MRFCQRRLQALNHACDPSQLILVNLEKLAMAELNLRWSGRGPQAPSIAESTWEEHKDLICQLRPTMTLARLMEVMASRHNFKASYVIRYLLLLDVSDLRF
jgi:Clr5 domain